MFLQSFDIPQADRLESVIQAIINISNGARTDVEIIAGIRGLSTDRQGRYYRQAAELLGFVKNDSNNAELTAKGQEFIKSPTLNNPDLIASVLRLEVVQRLVPYIELSKTGLTKQQIVLHLASIITGVISSATVNRRVSTLLSWLQSLDVITQQNTIYKTVNTFTSNLPVLEIIEDEQPILPRTGDLAEYQAVQERVREAKTEVAIFRNEALTDRARISHRSLINLTAERIRECDGIPKSNSFIDLAVTFENDFIFEMKSTTEANSKSQVRKGISQLYEYRYLENKPNAKLVLVVEQPLGATESWMHDYLEMDREILLVWDGENRLFGSSRAEQELPFLALNT